MMDDKFCITTLKNIECKVDVGISDPKEMAVHRLEIYEQIKGVNIRHKSSEK